MGGVADLAARGLKNAGLYESFVEVTQRVYSVSFLADKPLAGVDVPFALPTSTIPPHTLAPFARCQQSQSIREISHKADNTSAGRQTHGEGGRKQREEYVDSHTHVDVSVASIKTYIAECVHQIPSAPVKVKCAHTQDSKNKPTK